METNLRLYPYFTVLFNTLFWTPVFFLYFNERVALAEVFILQALYYFFVVIFEVPSGYFSDRYGRKLTLIIACIAFVISHGIFYLSHQFWTLLLAQVGLAIGFSFYSGTNHSLLYDSLTYLGREEEFGLREQSANSIGLFCRSLACILGGLVAMYGLENPYGLTAITSLLALGVCFCFIEPQKDDGDIKPGASITKDFFTQIKSCVLLLQRQKELRWLFVFMLIFIVFVHIPFEFFQSYIKLLDLQWTGIENETTLTAGMIPAIGMFLAAWVSRYSIQISQKIGVLNLLWVSLACEVLIAVGMAAILHPGIILLILCRNIPRGLMHAPFTDKVNQYIDRSRRATFFSLNSLAGRIAYGGMLMLLSTFSIGKGHPDWTTLSTILWFSSFLGALCLLGLYLYKSPHRSRS
ncbi:MAG: MFS transporter [Bdellovibrionales bacterium]|nr:MFS transporter [Bdellovibrionales bacterium]